MILLCTFLYYPPYVAGQVPLTGSAAPLSLQLDPRTPARPDPGPAPRPPVSPPRLISLADALENDNNIFFVKPEGPAVEVEASTPGQRVIQDLLGGARYSAVDPEKVKIY